MFYVGAIGPMPYSPLGLFKTTPTNTRASAPMIGCSDKYNQEQLVVFFPQSSGAPLSANNASIFLYFICGDTLNS